VFFPTQAERQASSPAISHCLATRYGMGQAVSACVEGGAWTGVSKAVLAGTCLAAWAAAQAIAYSVPSGRGGMPREALSRPDRDA